MTRDQAKKLREDLQVVLDAAAKKLGYACKLGSCSFLEVANFKLVCSPLKSDGSFVSKEAADYKRYAFRFGLPEDGLGKSFQFNGNEYIVEGLMPKSKKYPVLVQQVGGSKYKHRADSVIVCLNNTKVPAKPLSPKKQKDEWKTALLKMVVGAGAVLMGVTGNMVQVYRTGKSSWTVDGWEYTLISNVLFAIEGGRNWDGTLNGKFVVTGKDAEE